MFSRRPASRKVIVLSSSYRRTSADATGSSLRDRRSFFLLPWLRPVKLDKAREASPRDAVFARLAARPAEVRLAAVPPLSEEAVAFPPVAAERPAAVLGAGLLVRLAAPAPRVEAASRVAEVWLRAPGTLPASPADEDEAGLRTAVVAPRTIPLPRADGEGAEARFAVVAPRRMPPDRVEAEEEIGRATPEAPPRGVAPRAPADGVVDRTAVVAPRTMLADEGGVDRIAAPDRIEEGVDRGEDVCAARAARMA